MSICWYCYWGWAKPVAKIYKEALEKLEGDSYPLLFGPAHIVWSDENFEDGDINFCLIHFYETKSHLSDYQLQVVYDSLRQLKEIPEELRCIEPEDYDGENPELFPPKGGSRKDIMEKQISIYNDLFAPYGYYQIRKEYDDGSFIILAFIGKELNPEKIAEMAEKVLKVPVVDRREIPGVTLRI